MKNHSTISFLSALVTVNAMLLLLPTSGFTQVTGTLQLDGGGNDSPSAQAFFSAHGYFDAIGDPIGNYSSPYPAVITMGATDFNVLATCLDYYGGGDIGVAYQGTFNNRFSSFSKADVETSYLLDTYQSILFNADQNQLQASALSFAIWNLQDPAAPIPTTDGVNLLVSSYQSQALSAYNAGYIADNVIWTPNNPSLQSFMLLPPESQELGLLPAAEAAPGAPAPPMFACLAFAGALVLQVLHRRRGSQG